MSTELSRRSFLTGVATAALAPGLPKLAAAFTGVPSGGLGYVTVEPKVLPAPTWEFATPEQILDDIRCLVRFMNENAERPIEGTYIWCSKEAHDAIVRDLGYGPIRPDPALISDRSCRCSLSAVFGEDIADR